MACKLLTHTDILHVCKTSTNRTLSLQTRFPSREPWDRASFKEIQSFWKHLALCWRTTGHTEKEGQARWASLESCFEGKIRNESGFGREDTEECCPRSSADQRSWKSLSKSTVRDFCLIWTPNGLNLDYVFHT